MSILEDIKLQYRMGGMAQKLIFWNIACFLLSLFFYNFSIGRFQMPAWLALSSDVTRSMSYFWTFLSYSFLHAGIWHLIFNLIVLNFAGRLFQTFFSDRQLLGVYILGAIFSGITFVGSYTFLPLGNALLVGASGSIMAILFTVASYSPLMPIRLPLIGYVKLWQIVLFILLLDVLQIGINNTGGHIAHLAGSLFGFVYVLLLKRGLDLTKFISVIYQIFEKKKKKKKYKPFKSVHVNRKPVHVSTNLESQKSKNQQQIDEILDKISRSGYDSLTKDEKEFLFNQKE